MESTNQVSKHLVFTTVNNNAQTFISFSSITHVIADKSHGSWIWLESGKCVHVTEEFDEMCFLLSEFIDN